jgi:hypothetical protein
MNGFTLGAIVLLGLALGPNDDFEKMHADLLKAEKWEKIAWKGNLLEARETAFKEKKPLFLWCMDAKPLGSV